MKRCTQEAVHAVIHKPGLIKARLRTCVIHVKPCKKKHENKVIDLKLKLILPACIKRIARPAIFLCFIDESGFC